jgi:hypothetical protein
MHQSILVAKTMGAIDSLGAPRHDDECLNALHPCAHGAQVRGAATDFTMVLESQNG